MLDVNVYDHGQESLVMPRDLYARLHNYVTKPLIRVDGEHYWASPEYGIPADSVVVPEDDFPEDGSAVLMAKDGTAEALVLTEEQPRPG